MLFSPQVAVKARFITCNHVVKAVGKTIIACQRQHLSAGIDIRNHLLDAAIIAVTTMQLKIEQRLLQTVGLLQAPLRFSRFQPALHVSQSSAFAAGSVRGYRLQALS
ncbi:hypothetical protein D3C75_926820 [compost metagenome]